MPIDRHALLDTVVDDERCEYTERDCVLYALGVGFGGNSEAAELPFVYDGGRLHTVPTMANRFLSSAFISDCGWDFERVIHVGERLNLYRPLPPAARMLARRRVASVVDLGIDTGVAIGIEAEFRLERDGTVIATCARSYLARADGAQASADDDPRPVHRMPTRPADLSADFRTRPNHALLFRLVDSMNPVHVDLRAAQAAGFERPILQGRCTWGIACHAILKTICDYDFTLIESMEAQFTAPVYPGDTVTTDMWQDGNAVSYRCRVAERDSIVIDNGLCRLGA